MNLTLARRLPVVTAFAATSILAANLAFAAWSSTGSGSGTAQSLTSAASVIAAGTSTADLFPGAVKSVTVTISNPNPYPVVVTSIAAGTTVAQSSCAANSVTSDARVLDLSGLTQSDNSTKVISANGSGTYTLTTRMINDAHDDCKSKSFTLVLTDAATLLSSASTVGNS